MIKGKIFRFLGQEGYFLGTDTPIFSTANLSLLLKERIPDNYDSKYARDILGDEEICVSC